MHDEIATEAAGIDLRRESASESRFSSWLMASDADYPPVETKAIQGFGQRPPEISKVVGANLDVVVQAPRDDGTGVRHIDEEEQTSEHNISHGVPNENAKDHTGRYES
jgi:hypothetical protein